MSEEVLRAGEVLAERYRVDAPLGAGGMAFVFRATDLHLDRVVALKLLRPQMAFAAARFAREARAAGALQHPAVVKVFGYGEAEGRGPFIVFEYVEGETLAALHRRTGAMTPQRVAHLLLPVVGALAEAHRAGIIHRDLKPENLIVQRGAGLREHVRLLDFGIAAVESDGERITRDGEIFGTPEFMAPEQATGDPVSRATDVWAMGVVLYTLVTGRIPFEGRHPAATLYAVVNTEAPPLPPGTDPRFAAIIAACLAKAPEGRPADASALLQRLESFVAPTAEIVAVGAAPAAPVTPPPRRRVAALVAVAALVGGGLGYALAPRGDARTAEIPRAVAAPVAAPVPAPAGLERARALLDADDPGGAVAWLDANPDAGDVAGRAHLRGLALLGTGQRAPGLGQIEVALRDRPAPAEDPAVRQAALEALPHRDGEAAVALLGGPLFPGAEDALQTVAAAGGWRARWRAVKAIEAGGGDLARAQVSAYIQNLRSNTCTVRKSAVNKLAELGDARAAPPIRRMVRARNFLENHCLGDAAERALRKLK